MPSFRLLLIRACRARIISAVLFTLYDNIRARARKQEAILVDGTKIITYAFKCFRKTKLFQNFEF